MAKNEITILTVERKGCRLLRQVRNGPTAVWTTPLRRSFPLESVAAAESEISDESAAQDPMATVFAQAAAASGGEAVLGVPTSRLLLKLLRLPQAAREDLADAVALQMAKYAPYSGDDMTVAGEIVHESDTDLTVLAVALPHTTAAELAPLVSANKLLVERVDALMLGWWFEARKEASAGGRRMFLATVAGELDLIVADGEKPVLCRGLGVVDEPSMLVREIMVSLLNAEIENGPEELVEVIYFGDTMLAQEFADVLHNELGTSLRHVRPSQPDADLHGLAQRAADLEGTTLNLLPTVWRASNAAAATARRFWHGAMVFVALWVVAALALFGAPVIVKERLKSIDRALAAQKNAFEEVQNTRKRASLIESYMDRSDSALEAMRVAAERMPEGLDLTALTYRREEGLRLTGEATDPALVYQLKEALENTMPFDACTLTGVSLAADRRKHRFELVCVLAKTGEEAP